ncbi:MAG: 50S ribosomal protein L18 [Clostridia bacterium]|nr:50S ribosomal protein L18 [Clostridia bacterium]
MINKKSRKETRKVRHLRVRKKISGTPECPRLCVYKSNTGVYAEVIDDVNGRTLAAASTLDKEVKTKACNIAAATEVGTLVAKRAIKAGIKAVVFDRGGYNYHGRVKALAEAAREGGLEF